MSMLSIMFFPISPVLELVYFGCLGGVLCSCWSSQWQWLYLMSWLVDNLDECGSFIIQRVWYHTPVGSSWHARSLNLYFLHFMIIVIKIILTNSSMGKQGVVYFRIHLIYLEYGNLGHPLWCKQVNALFDNYWHFCLYGICSNLIESLLLESNYLSKQCSWMA